MKNRLWKLPVESDGYLESKYYWIMAFLPVMVIDCLTYTHLVHCCGLVRKVMLVSSNSFWNAVLMWNAHTMVSSKRFLLNNFDFQWGQIIPFYIRWPVKLNIYCGQGAESGQFDLLPMIIIPHIRELLVPCRGTLLG